MARYLIDSDVLIWVLRKREDTVHLLDRLVEETREPFACSTLTLLEIWAGTRPSEVQKTTMLLETLEALAVDATIARLAAELLRDSTRRRNPREWIDAVIASTAIHHRLILITYNQKDYPYPNLALYPL